MCYGFEKYVIVCGSHIADTAKSKNFPRTTAKGYGPYFWEDAAKEQARQNKFCDGPHVIVEIISENA